MIVLLMRLMNRAAQKLGHTLLCRARALKDAQQRSKKKKGIPYRKYKHPGKRKGKESHENAKIFQQKIEM